MGKVKIARRKVCAALRSVRFVRSLLTGGGGGVGGEEGGEPAERGQLCRALQGKSSEAGGLSWGGRTLR